MRRTNHAFWINVLTAIAIVCGAALFAHRGTPERPAAVAPPKPTIPVFAISPPAIAPTPPRKTPARNPGRAPRYSVHGLEIGMSSAMVERLEGYVSSRCDACFTTKHGMPVAFKDGRLNFIQSDQVALKGRCLLRTGDYERQIVARIGRPIDRYYYQGLDCWRYPGLIVCFSKERVTSLTLFQ